MARTAKPWWNKTAKCWMATVRGTRRRLGKDRTNKKEAWDKLHALLAEQEEVAAPSKTTFATIAKMYLAAKNGKVAVSTFRKNEEALTAFSKVYGTRTCATLKAFMLDNWCDDHKTWGSNTVRTKKDVVSGCLNWGVKKGYITANPFKECERPRWKSRAADCVIEKDEHYRCYGHANAAMQDALEFLWHTGARPSELCRITADDVRPERRGVILREHKTANKDKSRVIPLDDAALEIVERLCERNPTGPIFRNTEGKPWSAGSLKDGFRLVRQRAGVRPKVTLYSYRHALATRLLEGNVAPVKVATMLGRSVAVLEKHYAHLLANHSDNIDALNDVNR